MRPETAEISESGKTILRESASDSKRSRRNLGPILDLLCLTSYSIICIGRMFGAELVIYSFLSQKDLGMVIMCAYNNVINQSIHYLTTL